MSVRSRLRLVRDSVTWLFAAAALLAKPISPPNVSGYVGPTLAAPASDDDTVSGEAQFDSTTSPLPPNVPSVGFHAAATSEFGNLVHLSGNVHFIDSVTVTMSSWAVRSDYPGNSALGFTHPITLTLYAVDRTGGMPRPGRPIASVTTPFLIPWRPEADAAAVTLPFRPWRGRDGLLYNGIAFNLTFDLGHLATGLPDEVIFGVAFNTQHHGASPLGAPGPYDALHLGVSASPLAAGLDLSPGAVFWKTADGRLYADGGTDGVNTFRRDSGWTHFTPAVRFNNSAYGTLADAFGRLEALSSSDVLVSKALTDARALVKSALDRTLWDGNRQLRPLWGRLVFDLLAEAADELALLGGRHDALATQAQDGVDSLQNVATLLAESALGEAVISGGDTHRVSRAQDAFDAAAVERPGPAIDQLGNAWREAQLAIR